VNLCTPPGITVCPKLSEIYSETFTSDCVALIVTDTIDCVTDCVTDIGIVLNCLYDAVLPYILSLKKYN
jgi:hypothetical protein